MFLAIPFPDFSPTLFEIELAGFNFALRWYALAYVVGILFARWAILTLLRRPTLWPDHTPPLSKDSLENMVTWMILGIIIGGRLGFVLFYQPEYYLSNPGEILKVWQGGMSFHGGFLGVVVAGLVFAWINKINIPRLADAIAISAPCGLFLGRMANFINAELWGRETDVSWGVIFPGSAAQDCVNALPGLCARHPSQLYEAMGEGLILGIVLFYMALRTDALKRTGLLLGVFLTGYGVTRFLVEMVRQPDAYFQSDTNPIGHAVQFSAEFGLTMGQILSAPMILFGLFIIWRSYKRDIS